MRILAFVLAAFLSKHAFAQTFPEPKPTDAHEVLKDEVGTWECEIKMYLEGPEGNPTIYQGVETNKLVSGGLFLQADFKSKMGTQDFEGHALIGYNPKKQRYESTWVDNFTPAPTRMSGRFNKRKKTLTLTGMVQDEDGNELKQKQVTTYKGNKKEFVIFLVTEEDGEETLIKLMEMTSKKK